MKTVVLAAVAAAAFAAAPARSVIIDITQPNTTLAMVLGNEFLVGNQLFSVPAGAFTSTGFTAGDVFISPVVNADPLTGQGFRLTGAWNDMTPGDLDPDTFTLNYHVALTPAAVAAGNRLNLAVLRFNGSASGDLSSSRIDETLMNEQGTPLDLLSVYSLGNGAFVYQDDTNPTPEGLQNGLTALRVQFTATFLAVGEGDTATASFMDQGFGQTVIPAPGVLGMMLGAGALASRRRR